MPAGAYPCTNRTDATTSPVGVHVLVKKSTPSCVSVSSLVVKLILEVVCCLFCWNEGKTKGRSGIGSLALPGLIETEPEGGNQNAGANGGAGHGDDGTA